MTAYPLHTLDILVERKPVGDVEMHDGLMRLLTLGNGLRRDEITD